MALNFSVLNIEILCNTNPLLKRYTTIQTSYVSILENKKALKKKKKYSLFSHVAFYSHHVSFVNNNSKQTSRDRLSPELKNWPFIYRLQKQ